MAPPSDSTSHAALLTTQLRVHRGAVDQLERLNQTLAAQRQQTGELNTHACSDYSIGANKRTCSRAAKLGRCCSMAM